MGATAIDLMEVALEAVPGKALLYVGIETICAFVNKKSLLRRSRTKMHWLEVDRVFRRTTPIVRVHFASAGV